MVERSSSPFFNSAEEEHLTISKTSNKKFTLADISSPDFLPSIKLGKKSWKPCLPR